MVSFIPNLSTVIKTSVHFLRKASQGISLEKLVMDNEISGFEFTRKMVEIRIEYLFVFYPRKNDIEACPGSQLAHLRSITWILPSQYPVIVVVLQM